MPQGEYNKNVPPREYRYDVNITDDDVIEAIRSDETLTIGSVDDLIDFFNGREVAGPMGCACDIVQMAEEATLPRTFGDEIRNIPANETGGRGYPERLRTFAALIYVHVEYGFERRENNNTL
jgi:hypothetical protein